MEEQKIKNVAIVTYNTIGHGEYLNGVMELGNTQLHLSQKEENKYEENLTYKQVINQVMGRIDFKKMDLTYLYLGDKNPHETLKYVQSLDPQKVMYLMCDCSSDLKLYAMIDLIICPWPSHIIKTECGGRDSLARIVEGYIQDYKQSTKQD